jgi:hypothetical protein
LEHSILKSEYWKKQVETYRNSGKSANAWSKEQGISYSTLLYWIQKFCKESVTQSAEEPVFATVTHAIPSTSGGDRAITLRVSGLVAEISNHCNRDLLNDMFAMLTAYGHL